MQVESCRFGTVEVPEGRVVRFVRPILGFGQWTDYAFIEDEASRPVFWAQCVEAPEVLFPLVDAYLVVEDYGLELDDADAAAIGLERAEDARLLLLLTLSLDPQSITANLRAPVVWNTRDATAMQVVLQSRELPVRYPVHPGAGERRRNKEVARACANPPQG
ncbi:MAG: flagellar assembly protein FliW [Candidatus Brocadiia bacterium]